MRGMLTKKISAFIIILSMITAFSSSFVTVFADDTDTIKGKPVTITDPVTGCTYNYVNFTDRNLFTRIRVKMRGQVTVRAFCAV